MAVFCCPVSPLSSDLLCCLTSSMVATRRMKRLVNRKVRIIRYSLLGYSFKKIHCNRRSSKSPRAFSTKISSAFISTHTFEGRFFVEDNVLRSRYLSVLYGPRNNEAGCNLSLLIGMILMQSTGSGKI